MNALGGSTLQSLAQNLLAGEREVLGLTLQVQLAMACRETRPTTVLAAASRQTTSLTSARFRFSRHLLACPLGEVQASLVLRRTQAEPLCGARLRRSANV